MKRFLISTIIIALIVITTHTVININTKEELSSTSSIAYRVETNQNLIIEEHPSTEETVKPTDEEFTSYIETVNVDVETLTAKEELTPLDKETLKNTFITLTDFIFYNGEIKGKTFDELTTSAKEKIVEIYEKIDAKIESVYPGYKEKIKETTTKTYTNIKEMLIKVKDNIASSYKEEIGEERYNDQVETFNESKETMKESFEPVIDVIVEESKKIYEQTKEKLDNWYQTWKEENN